jgi:NAD+ kinase
MFPHTLSSRPIVLNDASKIKVRIADTALSKLVVTCDGREPFVFSHEAVLHIQKHQQSLTLLHPTSYEYFKTLREKLAWHG